jgi:hypothetical protein
MDVPLWTGDSIYRLPAWLRRGLALAAFLLLAAEACEIKKWRDALAVG